MVRQQTGQQQTRVDIYSCPSTTYSCLAFAAWRRSGRCAHDAWGTRRGREQGGGWWWCGAPARVMGFTGPRTWSGRCTAIPKNLLREMVPTRNRIASAVSNPPVSTCRLSSIVCGTKRRLHPLQSLSPVMLTANAPALCTGRAAAPAAPGRAQRVQASRGLVHGRQAADQQSSRGSCLPFRSRPFQALSSRHTSSDRSGRGDRLVAHAALDVDTIRSQGLQLDKFDSAAVATVRLSGPAI